MTDEQQQAEIAADRAILKAAPRSQDDWDDATWAAWWRHCERVHGDGDPRPAAASEGAAASVVVAPPTDRAAEELAKHVTRAIFALKSPPPPGSQHYRSGWDDGLEAAMDAARDAVLRRLAAEAHGTGTQQQPDTEAHPAERTWAAELYDPTADEWVPGSRYAVRDRAVAALEHGKRIGPAWKDGTPTQRRLVRATTTYTVEEPAPAEQQPAAADGEDPLREGAIARCGRAMAGKVHPPHDWDPDLGNGLWHCPGDEPFAI